jgi:sulfatase maturation enzyme AslB (radical SAM superfamily)
MKQYLFFDEWDAATKDLPRIKYLETMTTYACTLSCRWCTNYSDYGMKGGYVKWDTVKPWLDHWFSKVRVDCFGFIGGEPLLNPELETWVREFRTNYPYVTLMILTNTQLFMDNLWLLDCMEEYGMIYLKFSKHQEKTNYFPRAVSEVLNRFKWEQTSDSHYFNSNPILDFEIAELPEFLKTYKGEYGSMKPYSNSPSEAFKICNQQVCPILENGQLYKCSSVGMLHRVLKDHDQLNDEDWSPYLNTGLSMNCSDKELQQWVDNFGKPHSVCSMCPTSQDKPFYPHYPNVRSKIQIK